MFCFVWNFNVLFGIASDSSFSFSSSFFFFNEKELFESLFEKVWFENKIQYRHKFNFFFFFFITKKPELFKILLFFFSSSSLFYFFYYKNNENELFESLFEKVWFENKIPYRHKLTFFFSFSFIYLFIFL